MSDLAVENPDDVAAAAHQAARGQVVYITEHGERLAAIVPAEFAAVLESLTPEQIRELFEDLADAADVRAARAARKAGEPVIPWEQAKAEAGL
jgi:antitoxin (DNA-binding transcriptional repressor) of toxin-antitoxin stability system